MTIPEVTLQHTTTQRNGVVLVAVKQGDTPLESQELNIFKIEQRDKFLNRICQDHPGIERMKMDTLLKEIAEETRKAIEIQNHSKNQAGSEESQKANQPVSKSQTALEKTDPLPCSSNRPGSSSGSRIWWRRSSSRVRCWGSRGKRN